MIDNDIFWYCLRSQPKHEHIAAAHLKLMDDVDVFLPRIRFKRVTKRTSMYVTEALFPGYLFARFNLMSAFRKVQSVPGVSKIVNFNNEWPFIQDSVIEDLKQLVGTEEPRVVSTNNIHSGSRVIIAEGPFQGFEALVQQVLPAQLRIAVLIELLGQHTRVEIPIHSVTSNMNTDSRCEIVGLS